jgi:hypothetical protein
MQPWHPPPPELTALAAGLRAAFHASGSRDGGVSVVGRRPNTFASTFPSEIVTCRLGDGNKVRLLCKYEAGLFENTYGHRGGVRYETEVYQRVLQPLRTTTPAFYGAHVEEKTGSTWLFLEYLEDAISVARGPEPEHRLCRAAHWSGRFHRLNEVRLARDPMPVLNTYDAEYYQGWARRTSRHAGRLALQYPWLTRLCRRFADVADRLLRSTPTVIHGEFYPHNVLVYKGKVYPIDWESAAIAAGEIDLAALTESWPGHAVRACVRAYERARWPKGPPADFERTLDAARVYLHLRWLGDPDRDVRQRRLWSFEELKSAAGRLGMIEEGGA